MKCDVCGKNVASEFFFTHPEMENSKLCQPCFKSVNAIVAEGAARAEMGAAVTTTISHEHATTHRCQSCGGSCDLSQSICTACASESDKQAVSYAPDADPYVQQQPVESPPSGPRILGMNRLWFIVVVGILLLAAILIFTEMG